MDPITQQQALAAAGAAGGEGLYVDDVFSTYVYTGTGSTQTITNGIDLSGEGGMVWIKSRSDIGNHVLTDTERGTDKLIYSNTSGAEVSATWGANAFNADGFNVTGADGYSNSFGRTYASWTFRKAPGFFDVVTWTGDGSSTGQVISHNLGSTPGFIVIKERNGTAWWTCWHRSLGGARIFLNETNASTTANIQLYFGNGTSYVAPTDSSFTVNSNDLNQSGNTYVAYIFAHDDAQFGENEDESIIKCGVFAGQSSIDLGWEPQWLLIKPYNMSYNWEIYDNIRGTPGPGNSASIALKPNSYNAEIGQSGIKFEPKGFYQSTFGSGAPCIYIAIRRPHKPPETATDVFAIDTLGPPSPPGWNSGFVVDWKFQKTTTNTSSWETLERITGQKMYLNTADAAVTPGSNEKLDYNDGWGTSIGTNPDNYSWMFRRAPGFFDMVAYTGNGIVRTIDHNLGAVPELMIVKNRSTAGNNWRVYAPTVGPYSTLALNTGNAKTTNIGYWNNTAPTSSSFTVGTVSNVNFSNIQYVAFLFATLPGISKVGSYTGTGSTLNVDCGFTAGARFVLIKRADGTGDWYFWDSTRGIVSGNDPYLLINSTAVQVTSTDYIDLLNSGFTVTSGAPAALNANGGTYIFLAIA